jgi:putative ABC transport system ATP-binding protein
MEAFLQATAISRVFRTDELETTALRDIHLQINKGEFIAVMGPSGCGKTTLLSVLGLLDRPTEGSLLFGGTEVSRMNEDQRTGLRMGRIGFVFQSFNLIDELTVRENVSLPLVFLKGEPAGRRQRVTEVMERLQIAHRGKHFPQQLSGGQQQRVAIARALVTRPELILADEPTGNLDSGNGIEVMKLLRELNREGTTVVIVTHNTRDAEFAHRVIRLLDGKMIN